MPQMSRIDGVARPSTAAGRVRVQIEWVPAGASSFTGPASKTAIDVEANINDTGLFGGDAMDKHRPQSVGRAGVSSPKDDRQSILFWCVCFLSVLTGCGCCVVALADAADDGPDYSQGPLAGRSPP